jgi:hypothetical protein
MITDNKWFVYDRSPQPPSRPGGLSRDPRTDIGSLRGNFDYPSSKGLGVDVIDYQRRNLHPAGGSPLPVKVKMRDLPYLIVRDLEDAAVKGELREELHRHIDLLEKNNYADEGSLRLLRQFAGDLTGHAACDRDQLDAIIGVVQTLGPKEAK